MANVNTVSGSGPRGTESSQDVCLEDERGPPHRRQLLAHVAQSEEEDDERDARNVPDARSPCARTGHPRRDIAQNHQQSGDKTVHSQHRRTPRPGPTRDDLDLGGTGDSGRCSFAACRSFAAASAIIRGRCVFLRLLNHLEFHLARVRRGEEQRRVLRARGIEALQPAVLALRGERQEIAHSQRQLGGVRRGPRGVRLEEPVRLLGRRGLGVELWLRLRLRLLLRRHAFRRKRCPHLGHTESGRGVYLEAERLKLRSRLVARPYARHCAVVIPPD